MRSLILMLLLCAAAMAQPVNPPPAILKGNPPGGAGGACNPALQVGYLNNLGVQYVCPSATNIWTALGGGGGGSPSGSTNSIQTKAGSSTFGNAGFATSGGLVALGNAAALADKAQFEYKQSFSDLSAFDSAAFSLFINTYTGVANVDEMDGLNVQITNQSNVDVRTATALYGSYYNDGSGTTETAVGVKASIANDTGTITNAYAINVSSPDNSGTLTNYVSLKIEDGPGHAIQTGTGLVDLGDRTNAPAFMASGTTFTASGCGNGTLVGGATAGKFTSGDSGGSCSIVITMGASMAATNGWSCQIQDLSAPAKVWGQTASNATTATFLSPGVTTSGNVVSFFCVGY